MERPSTVQTIRRANAGERAGFTLEQMIEVLIDGVSEDSAFT
jgi:hypothetical protein